MSLFENGAIYGPKEPRNEDEDPNNKVTASKLRPIRDPDHFESHILNVSDIVCQPKRRKSKHAKVEYYVTDLCIILCRQKIKKVRLPKRKEPATATPVPVYPIAILDGDADCTVVSTITNSANTTSSKRKKTNSFKFPARKLSISLFAPIETQVKRNKTITGVPSGKTNKEIIFDLDPYIFSREDCMSREEDDCLDDEEAVDENERFISVFTFSRFRKLLILLAMDKFPEEYSVKTTSLGPKCKLFCQKQWNSSSWTEITDTSMFHKMLKEQMSTNSRVKDECLIVRLSFGRANRPIR